MSKSRGNLVRLSDELAAARRRRDAADHGLRRTARGRHRLGRRLAGRVRPKFLARAWRLSGDVTAPVGVDPDDRRRRRCARPPTAPSHDVAAAVESFRFNVAVARMMELVNATRKAIDSGSGPAPTRRCARRPRPSRSCCRCSRPYTAEEMWERLGHEPAVALAGWPAVDPALLVEETVTCVVQVAGKVRDRLEVSPDDRRGRAARAGAGRPGRCSGAGRSRRAHRRRARAQAGQRRPGLIRRRRWP